MQNATVPGSTEDINRTAEPSSTGGPPFADASFAGLLTTFSAPQKQDTSWNDDGLADDVATISYEQALRKHVRPNQGVRPAPCSSLAKSCEAAGSSHRIASADTSKPLKTASITIRLSGAECAQLRRRAAEAGLTVSAYLRSCTLEVETLRAQVKKALAELRNSAPKPSEFSSQSESPGGIQTLLSRFRRCFQFAGRKQPPAIESNCANPFPPVP